MLGYKIKLPGGFAVTTEGTEMQAKVGHALIVAGELLRRGDLDGARRTLWAVRDQLDVLLLYEPQPARDPESA